MNRFSSAAVAALLALPLAVPAVHAQDAAPDGGSMSESDEMSTGAPGGDGAGSAGSGASPEAGAPGAEASEGGTGDTAETDPNIITDMSTVVVSVGDTDITAGQVRDMLSSMPPQVQTQPMELLVPLAVEELVMRELVLQAAEAEGLADSPEVQEMANGGASEEALENAMITTYVGERMQDVATDEAVQAAYDEAAANTTEEIPPLDDVRPQIEQQLQQRRLIEIRDELKSEFDVVYYGPDGEPREDGADGMTMESDSDGASSGETSSDGSVGSESSVPDANGGATSGSGSGTNSGGSAPDEGNAATDGSAPIGSDEDSGSDDAASGN